MKIRKPMESIKSTTRCNNTNDYNKYKNNTNQWSSTMFVKQKSTNTKKIPGHPLWPLPRPPGALPGPPGSPRGPSQRNTSERQKARSEEMLIDFCQHFKIILEHFYLPGRLPGGTKWELAFMKSCFYRDLWIALGKVFGSRMLLLWEGNKHGLAQVIPMFSHVVERNSCARRQNNVPWKHGLITETFN